jgi:hypothetical protein
LNDPLIFEAIEEFGGDGYMIFFGILELLADDFNIHDPGVSRISIKKLSKNFQISARKLTNILHFFDKKAKNSEKKVQSFHVDFDGRHVIIRCHKFRKLCDEYTRVKMSKMSGVSQEKLRSRLCTDLDTDTDLDKDVFKRPAGGGSVEIYNSPFLEEITKKCKVIQEMSKKDRKQINVWAFVQGAISKTGHPKAIDMALDQCIERWVEIQAPWPYMMAIFKMKNGNFWEEEHIKESKQFKEAWTADKTVQELISKIGGGA